MRIRFPWMMILGVGLALAVGGGCATLKEEIRMANSSSGGSESFINSVGGKSVELFTLRNANGAEATITNYGGIVTSLKMPDRAGQMGDVVWGYDNLADYINNNPYFGCLVGRYGNRIAKGRFTLNGKEYELVINNGPNSLHGGAQGFDKKVWKAEPMDTPDGPALRLHYLSPDGQEGYPGNLDVTAVYTLTNDNALRLDYTAKTDKDTVLSLTHHSYFNFKGQGDILGHEVMINADRFTPVDTTLIPTGELRPVEGTPLDFTRPTKIGARINSDYEQMKLGNGYDHNFVLNKKAPGELSLAARVHEPTTGRVMEVFTTEPGMRLYTGNFLDGTIVGKGGQVYKFRSAFCMEPQKFPDSPNQPNFPSSVLKAGDTYKSTIMYKFSAK